MPAHIRPKAKENQALQLAIASFDFVKKAENENRIVSTKPEFFVTQ